MVSCKPKMICSAYASYYILDTAVLEQTFNPFGSKDSTPRELHTNKDKYGIAEKVDDKLFKKKNYIIKMKLIPPEKSDAAADSAASDSLAGDDVESLDDITIPDDEDDGESLDDIDIPDDEGEEDSDEDDEDLDLDDDELWEDDEDDE